MARDRGGRQRRDARTDLPKEFEQKVIEVARVTRVVAGGKRMRFRACVVIGDRKGRVGMAVAKGADVTAAVGKAITAAQKRLQTVTMVNETIPHPIRVKYAAARVLLKPAPKGTGIIAGGAIRTVLDLAGVKNVVAKMLGSQNKINNARATVLALGRLLDRQAIAQIRGMNPPQTV